MRSETWGLSKTDAKKIINAKKIDAFHRQQLHLRWSGMQRSWTHRHLINAGDLANSGDAAAAAEEMKKSSVGRERIYEEPRRSAGLLVDWPCN